MISSRFPYKSVIFAQDWNGMIRKLLFCLLVICLLASLSHAANRRFTLVIDPGHGGHDAGAKGATSMEKDINLKVALAFGRYVERNCPDVRVMYTRKTDIFIPLHERANIANKNKADLFISVHTNALPNGRIARGMETYTLGMHRAGDNLDVAKRENSVILIEEDYKQRYEGFDPNSSESYIMFEFMQDKNMSRSVDLARLVQQETCAFAGRPDKGVKQAGFLVLRETSMPSCLIELGFITTPDEEQLLNSDTGIDNIAQGIYRAFVSYKKAYDNGFTVPFQPSRKSSIAIPAIVPKEKTVLDTVVEKSKPQVPVRTVQSQPSTNKGELIFKVQLFVCNRTLRPGSNQFKGLTDVDVYQEDNLMKYTYGASTNYDVVNEMRRQVRDRFPDAFVVAFRDGVKVNIVEAVKEYKQINKK